MAIFLTVEEQYEKKISGLCGDYDHNNDKDFLLPEGVYTNEVHIFGNKWKTDSTVSKLYHVFIFLCLTFRN